MGGISKSNSNKPTSMNCDICGSLPNIADLTDPVAILDYISFARCLHGSCPKLICMDCRTRRLTNSVSRGIGLCCCREHRAIIRSRYKARLAEKLEWFDPDGYEIYNEYHNEQ